MRIQQQLLFFLVIAGCYLAPTKVIAEVCREVGHVWDESKGRCVKSPNENAAPAEKPKPGKVQDTIETSSLDKEKMNDKTPPTPAAETPRVAGDANTADKADNPTPQENTPREKKNAKGFDRDVIVAMPPWETTPPQNGARKEHFPVQQLSVNQIDNESNIVNVNVGPIGAHRGLSREEERKAELAKEARAKEDETVIIYLLTDLEQVARSKALRQDINDLKGSITQGDITPEQAKDILQSLLQNTEDEVAQVIAKNEVEKINLLNDIA